MHLDTKNLAGEELKKAQEKEMLYYSGNVRFKKKICKSKMNFSFISDIIDEILKEDDFNGDGYLSYLEYVLARRRDQKADETETAVKYKS